MADENTAPAQGHDVVANTVIGGLLGSGAVGVALAVGGIVAAPFTAGASLLGVPAALLGAGLGGWIGYKRAQAK